jgi:hypothetical protein
MEKPSRKPVRRALIRDLLNDLGGFIERDAAIIALCRGSLEGNMSALTSSSTLIPTRRSTDAPDLGAARRGVDVVARQTAVSAHLVGHHPGVEVVGDPPEVWQTTPEAETRATAPARRRKKPRGNMLLVIVFLQ